MNEEDYTQKRVDTIEKTVGEHTLLLATQAKDIGYIRETVNEIKTTVNKLEVAFEQLLHKDLGSKPAIDLIYGGIKLFMIIIGTLVTYFLLTNISDFIPRNSTSSTTSTETTTSK